MKPLPSVQKPELMNMTDDKTLSEGEEVHVYIGDSVSISINNFFEANYSKIEWHIDGEKQPNTDYVFVVKTDPSSPFYINDVNKKEETYLLTVKGAHIGGSETTFIRIKVEKPPVPKPILKASGSVVQEGGPPIEVDMGESVTIEIVNYDAYSTREWYSEEGSTLGDGLFYVVYTTNTPPFNVLGEHPLTFRGENSQGDFNKTTIKIMVNEPGVPKPELRDTTNNIDLDGANPTVEVTRGESVVISVTNASAYSLFEWKSGTTVLSETPVCFVSTFSPPFNTAGPYLLTVKGTTSLGFSKTTTITINVNDPNVLSPQLRDTTNGTDLTANTTVEVTRGESVTISVTNVSDYISFEWYNGATNLGTTAPVYFVSTTTLPFSSVADETTSSLTVKAKTILDDERETTINIKVKKPNVPKPQLKNTTNNTDLTDGTTVNVTMGESVTISVTNVSAFISYEWSSNGGISLNTIAPVYFVSTIGDSHFNTGGEKELTVKGTTSLNYEETTTIKINVIIPHIPTPVLENMNTHDIMEDGHIAVVDIGSSLIISINNYVEVFYDVMEWYIGTSPLPADTGPTYTVYTNNPPFNVKGTYDLKVKTKKYGEPHERAIQIKVRNAPTFIWKDHPEKENIMECIDTPTKIDGITGWTDNSEQTGGTAAWFKNYTSDTAFEADLDKIIAFMIETNGELWPMTEISGGGHQIYIRYEVAPEGITAEIRVFDGHNSRKFYRLKLRYQEYGYED